MLIEALITTYETIVPDLAAGDQNFCEIEAERYQIHRRKGAPHESVAKKICEMKVGWYE